jgi:hypothetical protein
MAEWRRTPIYRAHTLSYFLFILSVTRTRCFQLFSNWYILRKIWLAQKPSISSTKNKQTQHFYSKKSTPTGTPAAVLYCEMSCWFHNFCKAAPYAVVVEERRQQNLLTWSATAVPNACSTRFLNFARGCLKTFRYNNNCIICKYNWEKK